MQDVEYLQSIQCLLNQYMTNAQMVNQLNIQYSGKGPSKRTLQRIIRENDLIRRNQGQDERDRLADEVLRVQHESTLLHRAIQRAAAGGDAAVAADGIADDVADDIADNAVLCVGRMPCTKKQPPGLIGVEVP
jgi:hypothetical protein